MKLLSYLSVIPLILTINLSAEGDFNLEQLLKNAANKVRKNYSEFAVERDSDYFKALPEDSLVRQRCLECVDEWRNLPLIRTSRQSACNEMNELLKDAASEPGIMGLMALLLDATAEWLKAKAGKTEYEKIENCSTRESVKNAVKEILADMPDTTKWHEYANIITLRAYLIAKVSADKVKKDAEADKVRKLKNADSTF